MYICVCPFRHICSKIREGVEEVNKHILKISLDILSIMLLTVSGPQDSNKRPKTDDIQIDKN